MAVGLINGGGSPHQPIPNQPIPLPQQQENPIDVSSLFKQWLRNNPDATPEQIFSAGVDIGLNDGQMPAGTVQDGAGLPNMPPGSEVVPTPSTPDPNEFGPDVEPIPGMGTPTGPGFTTQTPYVENAPRYQIPMDEFGITGYSGPDMTQPVPIPQRR